MTINHPGLATRLGLAAALAVTAFATSAAAAAAAPNDSASCAGKLTEFNTKYPEVFGNRATVAHDLKDEAESIGITAGSIVSMVARRSTSVEQCL